jgi:ABC-type polar amino acid transport system ATPase subunit
MIVTNGLSVDAQGEERERPQRLDDVTFTVERGAFAALVGESGSGKSTLLRVLSGFLPFSRGEARVAGVALAPGACAEARKLTLRRKAVLVLQEPNLFPHLRVIENVTLALRHVRDLGEGPARDRAVAMLDRLGVAEKAEVYPGELSGGQAQRVALARALVLEPEVLLLDEPTSALDPKRKVELGRLFGELAAGGTTVLAVTHDQGLADAATARFTMHDGRLTAQG